MTKAERNALQIKFVIALANTATAEDLLDFYIATRDEEFDKFSNEELERLVAKLHPELLTPEK